jgi:hypothetical protein
MVLFKKSYFNVGKTCRTYLNFSLIATFSCKQLVSTANTTFKFYRNMIQDYEEILKCLRGKSVEDLTKVRLETPSFLTGMGPSRDGILIPADFGTELFASNNRKRAQSSPYQVHFIIKHFIIKHFIMKHFIIKHFIIKHFFIKHFIIKHFNIKHYQIYAAVSITHRFASNTRKKAQSSPYQLQCIL